MKKEEQKVITIQASRFYELTVHCILLLCRYMWSRSNKCIRLHLVFTHTYCLDARNLDELTDLQSSRHFKAQPHSPMCRLSIAPFCCLKAGNLRHLT